LPSFYLFTKDQHALISLLYVSTKSALAADALPATPTQEELAHLLEVWLDFQKDAENIPAIMGAVIKGHNILWQGAVGVSNSADGRSATTDSLTSICSITKVFTATGIMKLVDEGKLSLDEDFQALLPANFSQHSFAEQWPVTVRSLLTHSSGLPRDTGHAYWSAPDFAFPTEQQFIDSVSAMSTLHLFFAETRAVPLSVR
jgi:CubicO group peptidase (beta-lactamase class C family)